LFSFLVTARSKNGLTDIDDLYVKRRGFKQEGAFGGPNASKNFQGVHCPQNTQILGRHKRISNLTVHTISAQINSIGAACQEMVDNWNENTQTSFLGPLF
jgi:hypothetical protein